MVMQTAVPAWLCMVIELSLEHILVLTTHVASSDSCGVPWRASGLTHEHVQRDGRVNESTAKIQRAADPIFNFVNDTLFATV